MKKEEQKFQLKATELCITNLKMRLVSLIFILTSITTFSHIYAADNTPAFDLKWGKDLKASPLTDIIKTLKYNDKYIYYFESFLLGKPINTIGTYYETIVRYDRLNEEVITLPLKLKSDNITRKRIEVITMDSSIHVISYFNNKKLKIAYFFDETVDLKTFELRNDLRKIAEINYNDTKIKNSDDIFFELKDNEYKNKKRITLYTRYETKKEYVHCFEVFDSLLVSRAKYQFTTDNMTGIHNYVFDDDNNLYTIEREFKKGTDFDWTYSNIALGFCKKGRSNPLRRYITLDSHFITQQTLSINDKNQVICAGLYAKKGLKSAIGAFSIKFQPYMQDSGIVFMHEFDSKFITEGYNKSDEKDISKLISKGEEFEEYKYKIHDIHYKSDGGFYVIIEKKFHLYLLPKTKYQQYGDIYILSFNENGSLYWKQKIFRNQELFNTELYIQQMCESFIDYKKDDKINIMFSLIDSPTLFVKNPSKTLLFSIDIFGGISQNLVISSAKDAFNFYPKFSYPIGDGIYSVYKFNSDKSIFKPTQNFGILTIK